MPNPQNNDSATPAGSPATPPGTRSEVESNATHVLLVVMRPSESCLAPERPAKSSIQSSYLTLTGRNFNVKVQLGNCSKRPRTATQSSCHCALPGSLFKNELRLLLLLLGNVAGGRHVRFSCTNVGSKDDFHRTL